MLRDFSAQALFMGLLTAFVGFASSFAVVLHGLTGVGATEAQAASGLMAGRNAAAIALGEAPAALPRTTAMGALAYYVSHADPKHYVPSNIAFGLMPPLDRRIKSRKDRNVAISERALEDLASWKAGLKPCAAEAH